MLDRILEFCASDRGLYWLVVGSDISIAVAYFAIPFAMAFVLRQRQDDIPYPWLWLLFVTFIVACGLTHTAHVWSAISETRLLWMHAAIGAFCALVSVGTAIAFASILPQIRLLPSPKRQRAELEQLVSQRTTEKDQLIREINHRIGNQLQILSSMVSIETRRARSEEALEFLARLRDVLDRMGREHIVLSERDYLDAMTAPGVKRPDPLPDPTAPGPGFKPAVA